MDLELTGKVAVVTGASKGIGLAVTGAFVDEGARVVAGARTIDSLTGIDGVTPVALDLIAPDGPARLVQKALDEHGRVDVLVNNVGAVRLRLDGFLGTSDEEFAWAMEMNFFTALRATRAAIVPMIAAGGGAIVNVASVNAFFEPDAGVLDYGAAKAALVNLTKSLSQEFGPKGIRLNSRVAGPGRDRPVARRRRRRRDGGEGERHRLRHRPRRRRRQPRRLRHRPLHHPRGGRDARRAARLAPHGQRDRRELPHRRRADQDDVGAVAGSRPRIAARPPTIRSRPLTSATTSRPTMPSWPGNWPAPPSGPSGTAMPGAERS